jgi:hypothetical protein
MGWRPTIDEQPARDDDRAVGAVAGLERDAHAELHVGRLELGAPLLDPDEDAGEGLDRAARGRAAHGDPELGEERFTGNGELQRLLPDLELVGPVQVCIPGLRRLAMGRAL